MKSNWINNFSSHDSFDILYFQFFKSGDNISSQLQIGLQGAIILRAAGSSLQMLQSPTEHRLGDGIFGGGFYECLCNIIFVRCGFMMNIRVFVWIFVRDEFCKRCKKRCHKNIKYNKIMSRDGWKLSNGKSIFFRDGTIYCANPKSSGNDVEIVLCNV